MREPTPADPSLTSRHAALADADAFWRQFPVSVRFEKIGDEVVGYVTALTEVKNSDGEYIPKLTVLADDGEVRLVFVYWEHLLSILKEQKPARGDRVRIKYVGDGRAVGPLSAPKRFAVAVQRPKAGPAKALGALSEKKPPENPPSQNRTDAPPSGQRGSVGQRGRDGGSS